MNCHANVILFLKHIRRPGTHHFNAFALHLLIWPWKQRRGWKLAYIGVTAVFFWSLQIYEPDLELTPGLQAYKKGDAASSSHCQLPDSRELPGSAEILFKGVCKPVVGVNPR